MTTSTRPANAHARGAAGVEAQLERVLEPLLYVAVGVIALAAALPLLLVALPVCGGLWGLRTRPWWLKGSLAISCALPALGALLGAYVTRGRDPVDVTLGYVDVQLGTGAALLTMWGGGPPVDWPRYALAILPYALAGGPALGALGWLAFLSLSCFRETERKQSNLKPEDLGTLAAADETPIAWALPRAIGRKVITLLSAPPGAGKGYWLQGWVRAMQDIQGGQEATFYGLPVLPMRVLWCTEEGESVATTARRFGIRPGQVVILRRDQVQGWEDWPTLVKAIRKLAWKQRCQVVIFDTIRAWCPQAERTPEDANAVMTVVRQQLAGPGLAVVFVHHDRKGGGTFGEGVSGTSGLVGAVDILVELKRCSDNPKDPRRRMVTSRRYGDMDITATLQEHRYVTTRQGTEAGEASPAPDPDSAPSPPLPSHLVRTLTTLRGASEPLTMEQLLAVEGGTVTPLGKRLAALQERGLATSSGRGVKGDPIRWAAVSSSTAVRDDPTYMAYLKSAEWIVKRTQVLHRAGGQCERCHGAPPVEVHHLTYARMGDERPSDLVALCAPCHRLAHVPDTQLGPGPAVTEA